MINKIQTSYQTITLSQISKELGFHPDYLSRCLKKSTGLSFKDYLLQVRLDHAVNLLKNSSLSINEISITVGYQNETYFYKKFKEKFKCTPAEYRKSLTI